MINEYNGLKNNFFSSLRSDSSVMQRVKHFYLNRLTKNTPDSGKHTYIEMTEVKSAH